MKIVINLSNKVFYCFVFVGMLVLFGAGVYAFNGNTPATMGHNYTELLGPPSCDTIDTNADGVMVCGTDADTVITDTNAGTECTAGQFLAGANGGCVAIPNAGTAVPGNYGLDTYGPGTGPCYDTGSINGGCRGMRDDDTCNNDPYYVYSCAVGEAKTCVDVFKSSSDCTGPNQGSTSPYVCKSNVVCKAETILVHG